MGQFLKFFGHLQGQGRRPGRTINDRAEIELLDQGMIDNGAVKGGDPVQDGYFIFLDQAQDFGKGRVPGPGIGDADDPEAASATRQQRQGQAIGMVPG